MQKVQKSTQLTQAKHKERVVKFKNSQKVPSFSGEKSFRKKIGKIKTEI